MSCRVSCILTAALVLTSCSRTPERTVERVAIVAFENLSPEQSLDWAGRAIAGIAAARTAGDARIKTFDVVHARDAQARSATRSISGYFTTEGDRLVMRGTVRDEIARKTLSTFEAAAPVKEFPVLAQVVATQSGAALRPYTTSNPEAARELFQAAAAPDIQAAADHTKRALQLDPSYGAAHLAMARLLTRTGDRQEAARALQAAKNARFSPLEEARVSLLEAEARGDTQARIQAMRRIAELQPGDAELWMTIATAHLATGNFKGTIEATDQVLALWPSDETALNTRSYAYAYAGDLTGALRSFEEYRRRAPNSTNAIDSQAEALFYFGRYSEAAARFLEAHEKEPSFAGGNERFRAAFAMFLAGDTAQADQLFEAYLKELRGRRDPLASHREQIWRRMTNREPAGTATDSISTSLQAMWALMDGQRDRARALAAKARSEARDGIAAGLSSTVLLLAQPSASPSEWKERIGRALSTPQAAPQRERFLGWALLLDGQPEAAAGIWRGLVERTPFPNANEERLMLAWALTQAGKREDARKVVPFGFFPPASLDPSLQALAYSRMAKVLEALK